MKWLNRGIIPLHSMSDDDDKGGGGGGGDDSWHTKLPEELQGNETLAQFKNDDNMIEMPVSVAKSYAHVRTMVGADTIKVPKTEEEWGAVYDKLGRPTDKEHYVLAQDEGINPALQESLKQDADWFREVAHTTGLTDTQASGLFKKFSKQMSDKYTELQKIDETDGMNAEIQLRTEYGSTYDGKKILMDRALAEIGGIEFAELIAAKGINKNPVFVRAMFKVGDMMAEDLGLDRQTGNLIKSSESVQEEIQTLLKSESYLSGDKVVVQKVATLMQQLHGTAAIPETIAT